MSSLSCPFTAGQSSLPCRNSWSSSALLRHPSQRSSHHNRRRSKLHFWRTAQVAYSRVFFFNLRLGTNYLQVPIWFRLHISRYQVHPTEDEVHATWHQERMPIHSRSFGAPVTSRKIHPVSRWLIRRRYRIECQGPGAAFSLVTALQEPLQQRC